MTAASALTLVGGLFGGIIIIGFALAAINDAVTAWHEQQDAERNKP